MLSLTRVVIYVRKGDYNNAIADCSGSRLCGGQRDYGHPERKRQTDRVDKQGRNSRAMQYPDDFHTPKWIDAVN